MLDRFLILVPAVSSYTLEVAYTSWARVTYSHFLMEGETPSRVADFYELLRGV